MTRPLSAVAATLAASLVLLLPAPAGARVLPYVVRPGDTPESVAAVYYGNRSLAPILVEANALRRGAPLRPGQTLRLPSADHYRARAGDTLESVARRSLGDPRRASYLAQWSGLRPGDRLHEGADLLIPFQLVHRAAAPESLAALARTFYGDGDRARFLQSYNFRSSTTLAAGDRIVIPIASVRVRAVRLPSSAAARAGSGHHGDDAQRREAELAARVSARLVEADRAYRDGSYSDVPAALTKLLSEEDPSEAQLVAIHRLLAYAYVALGADEVAVKEFREVLARDPSATLDPVTVSPKIRSAFERAKKP